VQENDTILCPECGNPMENIGNISGVIYTSLPPQWTDVYVCQKDKVRKSVRKTGDWNKSRHFANYTEVQ
jgi:DNA topoisomerase IB